jgi:RimJ/RimL family protein N-acetyltransferase
MTAVLTPPRAQRERVIVPVHDVKERVVFYDGDRIYFRPIETEDEPELRQWINNPANWRTLYPRGPVNACREREWIESLGESDKDIVFGIVVKNDDHLIGTTGLHRIDPIARKAEFGICVGDTTRQGKGFGTEAARLAVRYGFTVLNLNRIALSVFASNTRAIFAYQKAGFAHEGTLRQAAYLDGRYDDVHRFAILREEWEEQRVCAD